MKLKKLGKRLLFPHMAIRLVLLPVATAVLVYALAFLEGKTVFSYLSYLLAFYTLLVWCLRIPKMLRFFQRVQRENFYVKRWKEDVRLRVSISLYGSLLFNTAYAVFLLCLGLYHASFWYDSMAGYYIFLAIMRFFLVKHTRRYPPGERMQEELRKYKSCGVILLAVHLMLSLMIFFMVYWDRTFYHHEITTIAMAAYTFTTFTFAIINVVRYRKYNSPVFSASKAISLAAASVSMLTLESTMLTTFDRGSMTHFYRRLMLGISGGVVSVFIIVMAIYMIVNARRAIRRCSR